MIGAIGLTQTVELAIDLVRPGGTVTLVGMTPQGERAAGAVGIAGVLVGHRSYLLRAVSCRADAARALSVFSAHARRE